jgi:hypothetical protein
MVMISVGICCHSRCFLKDWVFIEVKFENLGFHKQCYMLLVQNFQNNFEISHLNTSGYHKRFR